MKSNEDYPYNIETDLKRRLLTRKGEPVSAKLAHDIHIVIAAMEGDGYSSLMNMINTSRSKFLNVAM